MSFEHCPRPEHPKPQFRRDNWVNLNGVWGFDFDFQSLGEREGWQNKTDFAQSITVPFCPECPASGIGYDDFIAAVWYQRSFTVPDEWRTMDVLLHFGGVDYHCKAWVNGVLVGQHYGGSSSFTFPITAALRSGENCLVVCAYDDTRSGQQPLGKQSIERYSRGAHYSRTTGIWQTVWLEAAQEQRLDWVRIVPDLDGSRFVLTPVFRKAVPGQIFRVTALEEGKVVATTEMPAISGSSMELRLGRPRVWSPRDPHLYDLSLELVEGKEVIDHVKSYAGLRKFHIEGNRFYLNNEPIFLRFVLDQGFYPKGLWTAPSDAELKADIERSMAVGFNGARLHQKIFEERFHYWADRLGYLTWSEFCDWGIDFGQPQAIHNHQREWREVIMRDLNHPSIIAWTPFNETVRGAQDHFEIHRRALQETYDLTKALDPSRPCHDASGYVHVCTDIYTVHNYEQNSVLFEKEYAKVSPARPDETPIRHKKLSVSYKGQPYVVDEYGGTWWADRGGGDQDPDRAGSWGYGKRPIEIEEVYARIKKLTKVLTNHPHIAGFCYTQLTDIEQEENGIYTYTRDLKFDTKRLKSIFGAPAVIETE